MSSQPRSCGTANADSGGDDPVARRSIGSAALEPARTSPCSAAAQLEQQNAKAHSKRPTSINMKTHSSKFGSKHLKVVTFVTRQRKRPRAEGEVEDDRQANRA